MSLVVVAALSASSMVGSGWAGTTCGDLDDASVVAWVLQSIRGDVAAFWDWEETGDKAALEPEPVE